MADAALRAAPARTAELQGTPPIRRRVIPQPASEAAGVTGAVDTAGAGVNTEEQRPTAMGAMARVAGTEGVVATEAAVVVDLECRASHRGARWRRRQARLRLSVDRATGRYAAVGGAAGTAAAAAVATDQTGTYLAQGTPYGRASGPRIIPNPYDNTLLVQGTPQEWQQINNLLEKLDVAPRQVLIDAKIYEVDLTGDLTYGVESFLQKAGTANSSVPGHQLLGSSNSGLSLTGGMLVGQSRQLLAFLQASEQSSKTKVLSAPSVIATDSIPASITVGDSVPTVSGIAPAGVQTAGTTLFASSVQSTSTGVGLNILARVNPSGIVTMVINQNVTAPIPNPLAASGSAGSTIDSPSFSQRNVSTQVTVEDGDTVAIGGIITENYTETSSGIPFLDRLPYVGFLFGQRQTMKQRTELIIFLTPRVIYDTTQMTDATEELKQKVRGLKKMIKDGGE